MAAGAFGCTISGAGPTAVAVVGDRETGQRVRGEALGNGWERLGIVGRGPDGMGSWCIAPASIAACWPGALCCSPACSLTTSSTLPNFQVLEAMSRAFKEAGKLDVNSAIVAELDPIGAKLI